MSTSTRAGWRGGDRGGWRRCHRAPACGCPSARRRARGARCCGSPRGRCDASPTTSMSSWFSSTSRKPGAHERLVVGDQDTDAHARRVGSRARTRKPPLGPAAGVERAAVERDALAHPDEAVAGAVAPAARPCGPQPSSATSTATRAALVADGDRGARRRRRAWTALASASWTIRNAARSTPGGERAGSPSTSSVDGQAGRARRAAASSSTPREARAAAVRLGGSARDEAAELDQRLARDRRDQRRALGGALGSRSTIAVRAGRLDRDHAEVVRDGVVQLARDAHPLGA